MLLLLLSNDVKNDIAANIFGEVSDKDMKTEDCQCFRAKCVCVWVFFQFE